MNNFVKQVIEEKFASKAQQRFFYAKANEKGTSKKEKKKWSKWAKEFSSDTDFDEIPDKVASEENEVDEIVDATGNIKRGEKPTDLPKKGITSKSTSSQAAKSHGGSMGTHGVHGTHTSLRYWAESDMSKSLGYDDTLGDDDSFKEAYRHFTKELGLTHDDAMDRLKSMGYDEKLPDDKVRLVENPKKFMKDYVETVLSKKTTDSDLVKSGETMEIPPIIMRQINSLKSSLENNGLSLNDVKDLF